MEKLSGGCRCGAIRYECVSAPLAVSFCYCRDCQQASGGPFCNYAVVPAEAVTVTQGQTKRYTGPRGQWQRGPARVLCRVRSAALRE